MVTFNLNFSNDLENLYITDIEIDQSYQDDYYIHAVYLEYYKNRNVSGAPSEKALPVYQNPLPPATVPTTSVKTISSITVSKSQLTEAQPGILQFKDGLFYVIVVCQNVDPSKDYDLVGDMKAVLDWNAVYARGMAIVDTALVGCKSGKCAVSDDLEQAILCWHSIELSMAANDADALDRLWSRFVQFSPIGGAVGSSTCNCM